MIRKTLMAICAAAVLCSSLQAAQNIVVQKGDERWEIGRDENTKAKSTLKVGQKVTVHYRMTAASGERK